MDKDYTPTAKEIEGYCDEATSDGCDVELFEALRKEAQKLRLKQIKARGPKQLDPDAFRWEAA